MDCETTKHYFKQTASLHEIQHYMKLCVWYPSPKRINVSTRGRIKYLAYSILCIISGTLIYIIFRNDVFFLNKLGIFDNHRFNLGDSLGAKFVLYNLSDALWALSLMFYLSVQSCRSIRIVGLCVPVAMECLQLLDTIPGTFDSIDLIIYILISIIFYLIWFPKKEL